MKIQQLVVCAVIILFLTPAVFADGIEYVGSYDFLTNSFEVVVNWPYAYVCQHSASPNFIILDVQDPTDIQVVGQLNGPDLSHDIAIKGDYAYLANDYNGLGIVDISNPAAPAYVGGIALGDRAYSVVVDDGVAYVADGYAGVYLIDISDVTNLRVISNYNNNYSAAGILVSGDIIYLADHSILLQTIDISDQLNPFRMDAFYGPGYARKGIKLYGEYALVSAWAFGLQIIDVSDPYNLTLVNGYPTPGNCHDVYAKDFVYIADFNGGIQVLNIDDPLNPAQIGSYQTPGNARGITVAHDYIFVTDEGSLQILQLTATGSDETEAAIPNKVSLFRNYPNPFNSSTVIKFRTAEAIYANLSIYNIRGQKVETLIDGNINAGEYNLQWNAGGLSSGTYLARLKAGEYSETIRMQLIR